jgi:hypothetical protein
MTFPDARGGAKRSGSIMPRLTRALHFYKGIDYLYGIQDILGKRKKSIKDERLVESYLEPTLSWQLLLRV